MEFFNKLGEILFMIWNLIVLLWRPIRYGDSSILYLSGLLNDMERTRLKSIKNVKKMIPKYILKWIIHDIAIHRTKSFFIIVHKCMNSSHHLISEINIFFYLWTEICFLIYKFTAKRRNLLHPKVRLLGNTWCFCNSAIEFGCVFLESVKFTEISQKEASKLKRSAVCWPTPSMQKLL